MITAWDTETSDLPLWHDPSEDPRQPHIVRFAAIRFDDDGQVLEEIDMVSIQDGWTSAPKALDAHGITPEKALEMGGVPERLLVERFHALTKEQSVFVGHNENFDWRIMRIGFLRHLGLDKSECDRIASQTTRLCTMRIATPIVGIAPTMAMLKAGRKTSKAASLTECMKHFFDDPHVDAHDCMADVRGCARVYWHLREQGKIARPVWPTAA